MKVISQPAKPDTLPDAGPRSEELAADLDRLEQEEQIERDRRRQEELARYGELAKYD